MIMVALAGSRNRAHSCVGSLLLMGVISGMGALAVLVVQELHRFVTGADPRTTTAASWTSTGTEQDPGVWWGMTTPTHARPEFMILEE